MNCPAAEVTTIGVDDVTIVRGPNDLVVTAAENAALAVNGR